MGGCSAADRRARELEAVTRVDLLLAVQRLVVLPAVDDGFGEQTGTGEAAVDRPVRRLRDQHRRHVGVRRRVRLGRELADEFRPHDDDDDERGGLVLDDLAGLRADALERIEALALNLRRQPRSRRAATLSTRPPNRDQSVT